MHCVQEDHPAAERTDAAHAGNALHSAATVANCADHPAVRLTGASG